MSGYCVSGDHENCPDSKDDTFTCSCPCHHEQDLTREEPTMDTPPDDMQTLDRAYAAVRAEWSCPHDDPAAQAACYWQRHGEEIVRQIAAAMGDEARVTAHDPAATAAKALRDAAVVWAANPDEVGDTASDARNWLRDLADRIDDVGLIALPAATAALRAVLDLHRPLNDLGESPCSHCNGDEDGEAVWVLYPCRTVQAITAALTRGGVTDAL